MDQEVPGSRPGGGTTISITYHNSALETSFGATQGLHLIIIFAGKYMFSVHIE